MWRIIKVAWKCGKQNWLIRLIFKAISLLVLWQNKRWFLILTKQKTGWYDQPVFWWYQPPHLPQQPLSVGLSSDLGVGWMMGNSVLSFSWVSGFCGFCSLMIFTFNVKKWHINRKSFDTFWCNTIFRLPEKYNLSLTQITSRFIFGHKSFAKWMF